MDVFILKISQCALNSCFIWHDKYVFPIKFLISKKDLPFILGFGVFCRVFNL